MAIEEITTREVLDQSWLKRRFGDTFLVSTLPVMIVAVGVRLLVSVFGYGLCLNHNARILTARLNASYRSKFFNNASEHVKTLDFDFRFGILDF